MKKQRSGRARTTMRMLSQSHSPAPLVHGRSSGRPMHGLWRISLRCASNEEAARIHSHRSTHSGLGIAVNTTVFTIVNAVVFGRCPSRTPSDRPAECAQRRQCTESCLRPVLSGLSGLADSDAHLRTDGGSRRTSPSTFPADQRSAAVAVAAYVCGTRFPLLGQRTELGSDSLSRR